MSQKIRCANPNCRRPFVPDPRVKDHRYCGRKECRRLRKRRWQSEKMKTDPDYRKNQQESHQCWMEQNRDYYKRYRAKNPEYVKRNRLLQKLRDQKRRDRSLAKMDASEGRNHIESGTYLLVPPSLAKKDTSGQKVVIFAEGFAEIASFLQRKTRLPASARSP